jgi:hypothetical protein
MPEPFSVAKRSLQLTGLFEAELLVRLMLREWKHPLADDEEFRDQLLEAATEVLTVAVAGEIVLVDMKPESVGLITAICIAEKMTLNSDDSISEGDRAARQAWLDVIHKALPSCFCDPDLLF